MSLIGVPLLLCLAAPADEPAPKFPLGKETTYVNGPLDKDGYVDYEAALNDRLGKGVTAETNASVLLWKAFGPAPEGGRAVPPDVFKRMGMEPPPKDGAYYVGLDAIMRNAHVDPSQFEAIYDQQARAGKRPWTAKDYPHIAEWLEANEKPLALVVEATRRPDYYNPLISWRQEGEPASLLAVLLPSVQRCREAAAALTDRAMLRVAGGKYDDAWQDLLACHRLGRLVARGGTLIEALVGVAIDAVASNADLAYLEHAELTTKQIEDRRKDLQGLPPMPSMPDNVDLLERCTYLQCVGLLRRGGLGSLESLAGGAPPKDQKPTAEELKALEQIDWEPALREGNRWFDRLAAALRIRDRAERRKELDAIDKDMMAAPVRNAGATRRSFPELLTTNPPDKAAGKAIGDALLLLLLPAVSKVDNAHDRNEQIQAHRNCAGRLRPGRLPQGQRPLPRQAGEDLAPKYLAAVPDDVFSGKPADLPPFGQRLSLLQHRRQRQGRRRPLGRGRPDLRRPAGAHAIAGAETGEMSM